MEENTESKSSKNEFNYISPMCPSNNHYNNYRVIKTGNKPFVQAYPSAEYVKYKKDFIPYLKELVKQYEWEMINEFKHYYLDIEIIFNRTNSDPTNLFKCLQDVANGILWFDDKIILGRVQKCQYTYNDDVKEQIICKLHPVDYIGIWNSEEEYNSFLEKCNICKNYKEGNCKRLQDYIGYKITKDFDVNTRECLGFKEVKNKENKYVV